MQIFSQPSEQVKNILKKRYYEQKLDTAKSDIKQTWKLVNEVINRKKKDTVSSTEFKKDNERIRPGLNVAFYMRRIKY